MNLNFASVIQSDNPLTQNLYNKFINGVDAKKDNFREAIDMEKYHTEMYNAQLEDSKKKRLAVEEDAAKRVADYNIASKKIKQRYQEFLDKHKNDGWDGFENHWYWKHYFNNNNKSGYTELDNQLDNMNENRFHPIEMNNKGYYQIGDFEDSTNITSTFVENPAIYKAPTGDYVYDHDDDLLYPNQKNTPIPTPTGIKKEQNNKQQNNNENVVNATFKLKQKELEKEEKAEQGEKSEDFTSVDPKLAQIYQKTLVQTTPTPAPKRNLLFNYIYCLIFIIFLYLVLKSS